MIALLLGLAFNGGLAILIEILGDRVGSGEDLERLVGKPVLAILPEVPLVRPVDRPRERERGEPRPAKAPGTPSTPPMASLAPEARRLRRPGIVRVRAVPDPAPGAPASARRAARQLPARDERRAGRGQVDGRDQLRPPVDAEREPGAAHRRRPARPTLHTRLGVGREPGLVELLAAADGSLSHYVKKTGVVGPRPPFRPAIRCRSAATSSRRRGCDRSSTWPPRSTTSS